MLSIAILTVFGVKNQIVADCKSNNYLFNKAHDGYNVYIFLV